MLAAEIGPRALPWNERNYRPLLINVALTGAVPKKSDYPNLPTTPEEIAWDVKQCAELGAQVFHLHMRTADGEPTQDPQLFEETILRIRDTTPGVILCVTTSSRASKNAEERFSPLRLSEKAKPEFASLSMGSFNFPASISENSPSEIEQLAEEMKQRGITPELEVFEPGMLTLASSLQQEGLLPEKLTVNILLGNKGTSGATAQALTPFLSQISPDSEWAVAGIGRFQRKTMMLGVALGGNIRIGMEDDPSGDGSGKWSNKKAVELAIQIADLAGRRVATIDEARERLLGPKGSKTL
jgi:3-keto-5-aminohexanoate cleavage enzyme